MNVSAVQHDARPLPDSFATRKREEDLADPPVWVHMGTKKYFRDIVILWKGVEILRALSNAPKQLKALA